MARNPEGKDARPPLIVALALSTHPGPALAVTLVTVLLGIGAGLDPLRLTVIGLALLFDQASVGLSNDWIDAGRDTAVGRNDKPIARGWVSSSNVRLWAFVTAGVAIAVTIPLGLEATGAHTAALFSAWSYNVWLKRTYLSVLPFALSFGLLPLIVTLARPEPALAAPWAIGAGALLGVAAHFSNVLPDFADDRATGIRGLPHLVGRRLSGIIIGAALIAASALIVFNPESARSPLQLASFAVTGALALATATLTFVSQPTRLIFQLIIAAALINVATLAFGGTRFFN
jgi:4-hydroxybenzoate polyprenyltransferase